MRRHILPNPHGNFRAAWVGCFIAVAVFASTYRVGGVLIYPRLIISILGFSLVVSRPHLRPLARPLLLLLPCALLALFAALLNQEWADLVIFISLLVRGTAVPYFAAIWLLMLLGIISARRQQPDAGNMGFALKAVCAALLIQFSVTTLHLLNPIARDFYLTFLNLSDVWREQSETGHFRYSGIGGISIYDTAITYCVLGGLFLLTPGRVVGRTLNFLQSVVLAAIFFLCILHGRTGLFFALILVLLLTFRDFRDRVSLSSMVSVRAILISFGIMMIFFAVLNETLRDLILGFAGEVFVNAQSGEGFRSESTDDFLENHLRMPEVWAFLVGTGEWATPDVADSQGRSFSTDSGYILLVQFGGLLMPVAVGAYLIFAAANIARNTHKTKMFSPEQRALLGYLVFVVGTVALKGPIFFSEPCMTALYLIIAIRAVPQMTAKPSAQFVRRREVTSARVGEI